MTSSELRTAIETLWPGHGGQTRAAEHFSVNDRRIRSYLSGERGVPDWMAREVDDLLLQFPDGIRDIDPAKSIAVLQSLLTGAGHSEAVAAAMVLGAAIRNARGKIDDDQIRSALVEI